MGLRAKASAFAHPRAPHLAALRSRPFTAAVEILIPSTTDDDGALRPRADASSALDACGDAERAGVPEFYVARMTIEELLSRDFVEAHARGRSASLSAVCVDARIDAEDVACVTPCGRAHFSLTPSSHARLGVTGEPRDRGTAKHHAVVNLRRRGHDDKGSHFHDRLRVNAAAMTAADGAEASKRATYLCAHSVDGEPARMTFPDGVDARAGVLAYSSRAAGAAAGEEPPPPPPSSFYPESRGVSDGGEDAAAALASFHEYVGHDIVRVRRRRRRRGGAPLGRTPGVETRGGGVVVLSRRGERRRGAVGGGHGVGVRGRPERGEGGRVRGAEWHEESSQGRRWVGGRHHVRRPPRRRVRDVLQPVTADDSIRSRVSDLLVGRQRERGRVRRRVTRGDNQILY